MDFSDPKNFQRLSTSVLTLRLAAAGKPFFINMRKKGASREDMGRAYSHEATAGSLI